MQEYLYEYKPYGGGVHRYCTYSYKHKHTRTRHSSDCRMPFRMTQAGPPHYGQLDDRSWLTDLATPLTDLALTND